MSRSACQHPNHDGDRLVDRRDLTERRIEWRDLVTQGRFAVRVQRRECKTCVRLELLAEAVTEQEAMPL